MLPIGNASALRASTRVLNNFHTSDPDITQTPKDFETNTDYEFFQPCFHFVLEAKLLLVSADWNLSSKLDAKIFSKLKNFG